MKLRLFARMTLLLAALSWSTAYGTDRKLEFVGLGMQGDNSLVSGFAVFMDDDEQILETYASAQETCKMISGSYIPNAEQLVYILKTWDNFTLKKGYYWSSTAGEGCENCQIQVHYPELLLRHESSENMTAGVICVTEYEEK
ncbi:MAG: hypothetical protein R3B45_07120 [Bdellovibrionota bacterium]